MVRNPETGLTDRQQRFAEAYFVSLNATQAYYQAGYKAKTTAVAAVSGGELVRKPNIQAALAKLRAVVATNTGLDQRWVLDNLRQIRESAEHLPQHVRAVELVGKHLRMFEDQPTPPPPAQSLVINIIGDEAARKALDMLAQRLETQRSLADSAIVPPTG